MTVFLNYLPPPYEHAFKFSNKAPSFICFYVGLSSKSELRIYCAESQLYIEELNDT